MQLANVAEIVSRIPLPSQLNLTLAPPFMASSRGSDYSPPRGQLEQTRGAGESQAAVIDEKWRRTWSHFI
ncbi:hypothetical protein Ancab_021636 [Ancistrocladus abbreviatus]